MDESYSEEYADLYRRHWWWRSREEILVQVIQSFELEPPLEILDVGCGDGLFFPSLGRFGDVRGIEIDRSLLTDDNPFRDRICTMPLGNAAYAHCQFDLITALDVIEHIEDDRNAVAHMFDMLRPGGVLLATMPAFMQLWDHHDETNRHHRRYTKQTVVELLQPHCEAVDVRYLFHAIFLPKLLLKIVNLGRRKKFSQHKIPHAAVNRFMLALCVGEYRLLRRLHVPFGTSVLAVARKRRGETPRCDCRTNPLSSRAQAAS